MNIPFLDLHASYKELETDLDKAVKRVLNSGFYILGPEVEAFEDEFAHFCDVNYCIGVGNGLATRNEPHQALAGFGHCHDGRRGARTL